jgi:peptide-methionine (S)-S-oxide reductase
MNATRRTLCCVPLVCLALGSAPLARAAAADAAGAPVGEKPVKAATVTSAAKAIFAGGCFWCVESDFDKVPGVLATTSGYTGGTLANPTYRQVSSDTTGHAEAVLVEYDPAKVSYEQLLVTFWHSIDPTTPNRQFCDAGHSYRSAIFALDAEQLEAARRSLAELRKTKPFAAPIVTEIEMAGVFYPAEDYHQDYYRKNPGRYNYYRWRCGRDARLKELWGGR